MWRLGSIVGPATIFLGLLCVLSLPKQVEANWAINGTAGYYKVIAEALNSLPHVTFAFETLPSEVEFSIHESYLQSVGALAIPFAVVAVLNFLAGLIVVSCFACFRICRRCCRRRGCRSTVRRRSRSDVPVTVVKWLRISFALSVLVFCGIGMYGVVTLHDAVPPTADTIDSAASILMGRANTTYTDLQKVEVILPAQMKQPLSVLFRLAQSYDKLAHEIVGAVKHYEAIDYASSMAFFVLIALTMFFSIFACHFPCTRYLLSISALIWFGVCVIWIICGVFLSGSVAVADLCVTNDTRLLSEFFPGHTVESFVAQHYLFCNGTQFDKEVKKIESWLTQQASMKLRQVMWSRNKTAIAYWTQILNATTVVNADLEVLKNCNESSHALRFSRDNLCLDTMVGTSTITMALFFIGLLGMCVWVLGVLEWKFERTRIRRILVGWTDEEDEDEDDFYRTPLVEINPSLPDPLALEL